MNFKNIPNKNVAQQAAGIKRSYSDFSVQFDHKQLTAVGHIQPTSRSTIYKIRINYELQKQPVISVLEPELIKNFNEASIPHTYSRKKLCLYRPKYNEFIYSDLISEKIIPWVSLWLYYYEVWHLTGVWEGGGEHPIEKKKNEKKRKIYS